MTRPEPEVLTGFAPSDTCPVLSALRLKQRYTVGFQIAHGLGARPASLITSFRNFVERRDKQPALASEA